MSSARFVSSARSASLTSASFTSVDSNNAMLELAVTPYALDFRRPAPTSRGQLTTRNTWLVRAWCCDAPEVIGWGECGPLPGLSRDDSPTFGAALVQHCAAFNDNCFTAIDAAQRWVQDLLVAALPSFAFGVETALRDLDGGGRQRLWDSPFARGECGLPTHGLIWMDDVDGLLRQIEAKIAAGFDVIKLKIGALPFAQELELLRQVRIAYPAVELRLDANGAFPPEDALDRLDALAAFNIAFVEQPVRAGQWGVMAELCRHSPAPIALDEELISIRTVHQRKALLATVRPQVLILKPALLGGFAASERWIAAAEARSICWIVNSLLESNIGLNAICQWTNVVGGARVHGLGTGGLFANNIPSPLVLRGTRLMIDPMQRWQLPALHP
jgi:o-succinylbenzoate synthase